MIKITKKSRSFDNFKIIPIAKPIVDTEHNIPRNLGFEATDQLWKWSECLSRKLYDINTVGFNQTQDLF